jgi:hypothetical protein
LARSAAFLHADLLLGVYDRVRVAANSNSTAAGSSNSTTTGPRSASMVQRSPSTAAFSIFQVGKVNDDRGRGAKT